MKATFSREYSRRTPTELYNRMAKLDYVAPAAMAWLCGLATGFCGCPNSSGLLDMGSSFGTSSLLLNHGFSLEEIYHMSAGEQFELENAHAWMSKKGPNHIVGHDTSRSALRYARRTNLITASICADLERNPLKKDEAEILNQVDFLISSGAIGYVSERTIKTLLLGRAKPFRGGLMTFAEWISIDPVVGVLRDAGYVAVPLREIFLPQRRVADENEAGWILEERSRFDVVNTGRDGWLGCHPLVFATSNDIVEDLRSEIFRAHKALFDGMRPADISLCLRAMKPSSDSQHLDSRGRRS